MFFFNARTINLQVRKKLTNCEIAFDPIEAFAKAANQTCTRITNLASGGISTRGLSFCETSSRPGTLSNQKPIMRMIKSGRGPLGLAATSPITDIAQCPKYSKSLVQWRLGRESSTWATRPTLSQALTAFLVLFLPRAGGEVEKQILTGAPPFGAGSLSVISRNATE